MQSLRNMPHPSGRTERSEKQRETKYGKTKTVEFHKMTSTSSFLDFLCHVPYVSIGVEAEAEAEAKAEAKRHGQLRLRVGHCSCMIASSIGKY